VILNTAALRERLAAEIGIEFIDVETTDEFDKYIEQLKDVHLNFFPEYHHVIDEICEHRGAPRSWQVRHSWLLLHNDQPVGEYIFQTCLQRKLCVLHYLALAKNFRNSLPVGWYIHLLDAVILQSQIDLEEVNEELLAVVAEVADAFFAKRDGFHLLEVDYQEPYYGMHWPQFGPVNFFDKLLVAKLTEAGKKVPYGELMVSAVKAFLVDHYRIEEEHPVVASIIANASNLATPL